MVSKQPTCRRKSYSWARADWSKINDMAKSFCTSFVSHYSPDTHIETLWNIFKNFCMSCCLSNVPSKFVGNNRDHPWITPFIKHLTRRKQRAYNQARSSHSPEDWSVYYNIKRDCQRECRRAYNNYVSNLVDSNGNVSKRMWSFIKDKRTDQCGVATLKLNDVTYTKCKDKATILNNYFTSIFTKKDESISLSLMVAFFLIYCQLM